MVMTNSMSDLYVCTYTAICCLLEGNALNCDRLIGHVLRSSADRKSLNSLTPRCLFKSLYFQLIHEAIERALLP